MRWALADDRRSTGSARKSGRRGEGGQAGTWLVWPAARPERGGIVETTERSWRHSHRSPGTEGPLVIHDTNPNEGGATQILLPGLLRFVHYRSASADGIEPEREHSSRVSEPAPRIPWGERPSHPRRGDHETPCDHQFATGIRRWLQYPCFRCPAGGTDPYGGRTPRRSWWFSRVPWQ